MESAGCAGDDLGMARDFKPVDRDQVMLLPPDLRDWLPKDHLAWLVLDVIDQCDLGPIVSSFKRGGTGREAYDPAMLTALLVYAYCTGERSSRRIERACVTDLAFRVITAQQRPDHTTIARFRSRHASALAGLFGQVLAICGRVGMGRVGSVAIDGTKIAGQASPRKNFSEKHLRELAADMIAEAERVDAAEDVEHGDRNGDELPDDLAPGSDRQRRIRAALDDIAAERGHAVAEDVMVAERKLATARRAADRERRDAEARRAGRKPSVARCPVDELVKVKRARDRVDQLTEELQKAVTGEGPRARNCRPVANPSDPDTHLMFQRGKGFLQGFNAQIAVSDDHLILATDVTRDTTDRAQFVPMMNTTITNIHDHLDPDTEPGVFLADAGYCSIDALTAEGPDRLIATGRQPDQPAQGGTDPDIRAMAERLKPDQPDRTRYQRRQATVEPVIGQLKDRIRFRRFLRRGLQAARHELALAATAHNILRLATG